LCLDVGEIRAGRRRATLSEIEVELKRGDPSRLFELASALAADLPVRVTHTSKADRGHALARGAPPRPRKARAVELPPEATREAALAAIATECIAQIEANAEAMLAQDNPEYLHQLRVGWRRLRSLPKLAAPLARDWSGPVLQQRHDKLSKRARHIHRVGAADRHRARVAAKKLRYAAEFFAPLFSGKRVEAYVAALSKLQSVLGRLNDFEIAGKLLDEIEPQENAAPGVAHAMGIVRGWLAASVAPQLKRLRKASRTLAKCEPFWGG